jgi:hypothetical protein
VVVDSDGKGMAEVLGRRDRMPPPQPATQRLPNRATMQSRVDLVFIGLLLSVPCGSGAYPSILWPAFHNYCEPVSFGRVLM